MPASVTRPPRGPVRVVLATTTLLSFISSWRATALALAELGGLAFFASGAAERALGQAGAWCVLGAVLLGCALRAVDLESCALFVRGGLAGAVREAFGPKVARIAAAAQLVDHLCFGALAAMVAGQYIAALGLPFLTAPVRREIAAGDASTVVAIALIGTVWWWQRQGQPPSARLMTHAVLGSVGMLVAVVLAAVATVLVHGGHLPGLAIVPRFALLPPWVSGPVAWFTGIGYCLFAVGSVEALAHVAPELRQPRIRQLRQTALLVSLYSLAVTAAVGFLATAIVPAEVRKVWFEAPLAALALNVGAPAPFRWLLLLGVTLSAGLLLANTVYRSAAGAQGLLLRLCEEGILPQRLRALHSRFGTPWHLIDLGATAQIAIILATGGQVSWLARVYAVGLVWSALTKTAALVRLRTSRPAPRAFRVPLNLRVSGREWPVGLWVTALLLGVPAVLLVSTGDPATLGGMGLLGGFVLLFVIGERAVAAHVTAEPDVPTLDQFQVLASADVSPGHVEARPGNLLVPIRKPHFLAHLSAALAERRGPRCRGDDRPASRHRRSRRSGPRAGGDRRRASSLF